MDATGWTIIIVYSLGYGPASYWFIWLDRNAMHPAPVLGMFMALFWPLTVPLTLAYMGVTRLAWRMHARAAGAAREGRGGRLEK